MTAPHLEGLDLARLQAWLDRERPGFATGPLRGRRLVGGLSNLSYDIRDDRHRWVLRRPPLGHVLSTAHDMSREYRVMGALAPTDVPVPPVRIFHSDADGTAGVGADFYLMDFIDGRTLNARADNAAYDRAWLGAIGPALVGVLARLHELDPAAVGLDDFGRPAGFLERQVSRWRRQLDASRSRPVPGVEALLDAVGARIPDSPGAGIIHGDYRLDNTLVADDGTVPRIAAVLDWEMSTLGDPFTDLGLLGVYWRLHEVPGAAESPLASAIDPDAGYSSFAELVDVYASIRGIVVPDISWYVAFAAFKLAVILEGIHFRHSQGMTVGEGFDAVGRLVPGLAALGLDQLKQTGRRSHGL